MKIKKKQAKEIKRITEYMVSGGAFFWSGYLVFFLLDKGLGAAFFWAKSISTLVGWTVNYLLQRYWVFKNPALAKHQTEVTGRYTFITIVNFILDYFIVYGLKVFGITPYIGQFISSAFFTVWNYLWYKFWVFPEKFTKSAKKKRQTPARILAHHPHGHSAYRVPK
jgi:putative flippase GtrA